MATTSDDEARLDWLESIMRDKDLATALGWLAFLTGGVDAGKSLRDVIDRARKLKPPSQREPS